MLEDYIEATIAEEPEERTPKPNLSKKETRILNELGKNRDIVIKKADKGSRIVVQDQSTYISEGSSHLADASTYKPLDSDPTASTGNSIGELVDSMKKLSYLDTYTHAYMLSPEKVYLRTQRMYFLKKLHKTHIELDP